MALWSEVSSVPVGVNTDRRAVLGPLPAKARRRLRYRPIGQWAWELIAAWLGAGSFVIVFGLAVAGLFD
jgi:hypothetical protein